APPQLMRNMLTIGSIGLVLGALVLLAIRTRRRVKKLERALGPDRVLSIEEIELPAQTSKELTESLDWLEEVYDRIPLMDTESLHSLQQELSNTLSLLNQAIARDALSGTIDDSLSHLKQALIIRVRLVLKTVTKEIESRLG
ncbi:MAG: hypothetical protein ACFFC0_09560, partial [Promethearchaeota archaeon]